ncbi:MAG TPA: hypothetical protein DDX40_06670 [Rikenellaceae bacterium]|nr:hypothetical protein [Rikenellaceae bacterium]
MRIDGAADIRLGERPVSRVMLGDAQVWPVVDRVRLDVSPRVIWLLRAADWTDYVDVLSNVEWRVG